MRNYSCYYYRYDRKNKKLISNKNTACWSYLDHFSENYWAKEFNTVFKRNPDIIYVSNYIEKDLDEKYRKQLIYILNKITPCREIVYNGVNYLAVRLIHHDWYDNNLVILNWIRGLWHEQATLDVNKFYTMIMEYKDEDDPLYFLMNCNKKCYNLSKYGNFNHSNVGEGIIPKNKEQLFLRKEPYLSHFMKRQEIIN
jgi:hypothetical protein